jgi:hypothetical protein
MGRLDHSRAASTDGLDPIRALAASAPASCWAAAWRAVPTSSAYPLQWAWFVAACRRIRKALARMDRCLVCRDNHGHVA